MMMKKMMIKDFLKVSGKINDKKINYFYLNNV